eukprot:NODE_43_length_28809_cov_0.237200.p8 type:complete len:469 gc:universal NODE_43_length_28809_cov_0.237200:25652-27058(+)
MSNQQIILYQLSSSIILKKGISIEVGHDVKLTDKSTQQGRVFFGVLGIIHLINTYCFLIKEQVKIGQIRNCSIYKVVSIEAINCTKLDLTNLQHSQEQYCLEGLTLALNNIYFSPDYDLTLPLRCNTKRISTLNQGTFSDLENTDFWFNSYLQQPLSKHPEFQVKAISGFVELKPISLKSNQNGVVQGMLGLISRKLNKRGGTRYHSRGIDSEGYVSNCVETEQFCLLDKDWQSYLQVRGSIPLFWRHIITGAYAPLLQIHDAASLETKEAYLKHLKWLESKYGSQTFVNLVNLQGSELLLAQGFAKQLIHSPQVHYVAFDFHKECSKLRWHRLSILLDQITKDIANNSFDSPSTQQKGIIRTNCIDCLDRTNVVQSNIAKHVLLEYFKSKDFTLADGFESILRNVWADNADAISFLYSGTGALKTDYTRMGVRTKLGALQDGQRSVIRYIKNNFLDGVRQDGYLKFM